MNISGVEIAVEVKMLAWVDWFLCKSTQTEASSMLGCGWGQKVAVAIGRNEGSDVETPILVV